MLRQLKLPLKRGSDHIWKCGFEKCVVNKGWNGILNKELRIHGRKIHRRFLREWSLWFTKLLRSHGSLNAGSIALTLFLATTLSPSHGTGLQQLLLDKAVLICTLHALNKKRLDLEEKLLYKDCIITCGGACMYMDEVLHLMQRQQPQDGSHLLCLGGPGGTRTKIAIF